MDPVRATVFEWFKEEVAKVWGRPSLLERLFMSEEEPRTEYASLTTWGNRRAIGTTLVRFPLKAELRVSDELLKQAPEFIRAILIHEAFHLGYLKHTSEFRDLVRAAGGYFTGSEAEGKPIRVQKKVGSRYQTVREFPRGEEREALAWGKEQVKLSEPGTRWRMLQGYPDEASDS